ncbi:MAG: cation:proton antiporter [Chitinivibrionales bacterium]|nr:cation:proton antiporter [Chitinivibrionales bacterium]
MIFEISALATVFIGFFGMIFKKNLLMKILAMDVMSAGVIVYFVVISSRAGIFSPIFSEGAKVSYADPVPQAVILTAIVIGFSILALLLVGAMKLARRHPTLEVDEIEKNLMQ